MRSTFKSARFLFCLLCLLTTIPGCSSIPSAIEKESVENTAFLEVGRHLEVNNTDDSLILYDYKEALASDGLYYASWRIGDAIPYENSDATQSICMMPSSTCCWANLPAAKRHRTTETNGSKKHDPIMRSHPRRRLLTMNSPI